MINAYKKYLELVNSATPAQIEQATQWYADAELVAHDVMRIFNLRGIPCSLENAACVVSAFSPRQRWSRNVVQALEFAHGEQPVGLKNNLRMAQYSLKEGFKALKGLKTNAFARAIAGDDAAVTIDVWMIKAAGLNKDRVNKSEYTHLVDCVNKVAKKTKLTPRTTQALIWIIYRGSNI